MLRIALKGLLARPMRTTLTALAIVVGVATITAAFTLTDTMGRAADDLSSSAYDGTAAVVTAPSPFASTNDNENLQQPTIAAGTIDRVRAVPGVATAAGDITDLNTKIVGKGGKVAGDGPWFGIGLDPVAARSGGELSPFRLKSGTWAAGPGKGGGTVKTGRHIRYAKDTPIANLWMSMLDRVDVRVPSLGDSTGTLPNLT